MKIKLALFVLLPTIVILSSVEIVCRFFSPKSSVFWANPMMLQYPVTTFDLNVTREKLNFSTDPSRVVRYVPDPVRWYRLDPEPTIPQKGKLVLHFGDSSTWGWGIDRQYSYPEVLNGLLPDSVHSINLGVPGYSSLQGLEYLKLMLKLYHERVVAVTVYFGNNDAVENGASDVARMRAVGRKGLLVDVNFWLEEYSAFYRVLRRFASKARSQRVNTLPRVPPDEYRQNLQSMIELCKKYDIRIILIQPLVHWGWPPGHLTHLRSLVADVQNKWVLNEMRLANRLYWDGLQLLYSQDDRYQLSLEEAVGHDWIMSRIKRDWREVLDDFAGQVDLIQLPDAFVEDEYPGWFVDYCHPSARVHSFIARDFARRMSYED